jgi:hypothetical protein
MNENSKEELPVPRAERNAGGTGAWIIYLPGKFTPVHENGLKDAVPESVITGGLTVGQASALIESAKLREELEAKKAEVRTLVEQSVAIQMTILEERANGNRVAAALGLPEGAGVDEVLRRISVDIVTREERRAIEILRKRLRGPVVGESPILDLVEAMNRKLDVRELEGMDAYINTIATLNENRKKVCASLGLPDDSEVDEVIAAIRAFRPEDDSAGYTVIYSPGLKLLKEFRAEVKKILGGFDRDDDTLALLRSNECERKETLQQLSNLGKFIGHPGATPAHVVSETVSLVEKFLKTSDLMGIKMDQAASMIAEDMVAKGLRVQPFREHIAKLGEELGVPYAGGNGTRILDAMEQDRASWKQRALAAEAKLAGGPEDADPYMAPEVREELRREAVEAALKQPSTFLPGEFRVAQERDNWEETAAQGFRNTAYYQRLLDRIGLLFGEAAFTADDGGRAEGILRAKVPELVEQLMLDYRALQVAVKPEEVPTGPFSGD